MAYIGKVQLTNNGTPTTYLIGSTAYGVCYTLAGTPLKELNPTDTGANNYINADFPPPLVGSTIYVKFENGNTAIGTETNPIQLRIGGSQNALCKLQGLPQCESGAVFSLTFVADSSQQGGFWKVNEGIDTTYTFSGKSTSTTQPSSDAYFSVQPSSGTTQYVTIAGLKDGAYKEVATTRVTTDVDNDKLPTVSAVKAYITAATNDLGITGAMHFRGTATVSITNNSTNHYPHINGYDLEDNNEKPNFSPEDGDVILYNSKEFVWASGAWHELGDESSYLLADSITDSPISVSGGATPTFGVSDGVLTITPGTDVTYSGPSQVYIPVSTTPSESP